MKFLKGLTILAFAATLALVLAACGGSAGSPNSSSASGEAGSSSVSETPAESGELAGKPWVTSIVQGNLPAEAPDVKDDLYTHYNYEYLAAHQEQPVGAMEDCSTEVKTTNLAVIKDASKTSHDLDQLRILFEQASDAESLQKKGLADVQPYLDRIDAVTSIKEMNELLTAEDFPFSPFVRASITVADTRDVNIVSVSPNLALVSPTTGGAYYQDTDDPQQEEAMQAGIANDSAEVMVDLMSAGMTQDEIQQVFATVLAFEKAHGKYAEYNSKYSGMPFGAAAEIVRNNYFTLDKLCEFCPNFPMKATLDKMGKGGSPTYGALSEWLQAFNGVWTDDNIEAIKLVAKMRVLAETRPYRDPSAMNQLLESAGQPAKDAETFAYEACDQENTLAIVLAQAYTDEALGPKAKERLTNLAQELVDAYKGLISETQWVGEESQQRIIEKLDNMTLNVLEPVGGYYDFSGVELTPTDQGGTLIGNYLKLKQYRLDQESKMIGQPAVAAVPWFTFKPTTFNCFYEPTSNSININPGYVTSLVYDENMDNTELLAGIGYVIAHEISHGFDYQGAQIDAYGTPNPVFTDADAETFTQKSSALASYYDGIEVVPGTMADGENDITEAAADLCGMQVVLKLASKDSNIDYDKFFSKLSSVWAQVVPEATLTVHLLDNHPLRNLRVNVNVQMFDPIYDVFGVSEGNTMYLAPEKRINIWGPNA